MNPIALKAFIFMFSVDFSDQASTGATYRAFIRLIYFLQPKIKFHVRMFL